MDCSIQAPCQIQQTERIEYTLKGMEDEMMTQAGRCSDMECVVHCLMWVVRKGIAASNGLSIAICRRLRAHVDTVLYLLTGQMRLVGVQLRWKWIYLPEIPPKAKTFPSKMRFSNIQSSVYGNLCRSSLDTRQHFLPDAVLDGLRMRPGFQGLVAFPPRAVPSSDEESYVSPIHPAYLSSPRPMHCRSAVRGRRYWRIDSYCCIMYRKDL